MPVDTSGFAFPKPKDRKLSEQAQRKPIDRTVLKGKKYDALRFAVCERAEACCETCGGYTPMRDGELDHKRTRGMGGGFRDDTLANSRWSCRSCHYARHNPGAHSADSRLVPRA